MREEMNAISMNIILHAGDSKLLIEKALECVKKGQYCEAKQKMEEAKKELVKAHESQTDLVQQEAAGKEYPNSLLFNHAQDTLMTTMSLYEIVLNIIDIADVLDNKINLALNRK